MVYLWGSLGNNDIRSSPAEFLTFFALYYAKPFSRIYGQTADYIAL